MAFPSAETELCTMTKGVAQALGLMSLLTDFEVKVKATIHIDRRPHDLAEARPSKSRYCHRTLESRIVKETPRNVGRDSRSGEGSNGPRAEVTELR